MQNDVNMYRKKLVKDLYENPDNNPQDLSDEVIASGEYDTLNIDNSVLIRHDHESEVKISSFCL